MKAKPQQQHLLLKLQEHDLALQKFQHQLNELFNHENLKQAEQQLLSVRQEASTSQHDLDEVRLQIEKLQDDVRLVDERLERDHILLTQNLSPKEAQGIEAEITRLVARKSLLEDSQLELMEALEDIEATHHDIVEKERAIQAEIDGYGATIAHERSQIEDAIQDETGARRIIAASIEPELVALYEKQRERYGIGASKLVGQYSQAVGVELSREDMIQINQTPAEEVVICPVSNAILVRDY